MDVAFIVDGCFEHSANRVHEPRRPLQVEPETALSSWKRDHRVLLQIFGDHQRTGTVRMHRVAQIAEQPPTVMKVPVGANTRLFRLVSPIRSLTRSMRAGCEISSKHASMSPSSTQV